MKHLMQNSQDSSQQDFNLLKFCIFSDDKLQENKVNQTCKASNLKCRLSPNY